jgi:2-dehydropantoate 2-reductase
MTDPFPAKPRIAIVGSGAVGCYYGGRLAQHGADVHFLMRSDFEVVSRDGLHVRSHEGDFHLEKVNAHRSAADIGPCDLVIVAMKATANDVLLTLLPPLLKEETLILTLQNGLGCDDYLARQFGERRVLGGLCFVCINRTAPGVIEHFAQGHISLGEYSGGPRDRTRAIAALFKASRIPCSIEDSLLTARWKKLVWNIPFNGLSIAAGNKDTAAILADPALEQRVRVLMREIIDTAGRLGHSIPLTLIDSMIERTRTMSAYKPSSLIDHLAGREVELDAIWSEPLHRAHAKGIAMPELERLHAELRALLK